VPYDTAPSDFYLLGFLKEKMRGQQFAEDDSWRRRCATGFAHNQKPFVPKWLQDLVD
jgi:hypothetical protein